MRAWILICLFLCTLFAPNAIATEKAPSKAPAYSADVTTQLVRLQVKIAAINEMTEKGEITQAQAKTATARYLEDARTVASSNKLTLAEVNMISGSLDQAPQKLTWLQKAAGLLTFVNIMWMLAIILGVVCFVILFGRFLMHIPPEFYEFVGYGLSIALVCWGNTLGAGVAEYVTFSGSLLFVGLMYVTTRVHKIDLNEAMFFSVATIALAISAVMTMNPITGFAAVITFMCEIGFMGALIPFGYVIGFKDGSALSRGTSAGFIVLIFYTGLTALGHHSMYFDLFRTGALWMGSFVGYLGLLIASSRWHTNRQAYPIMQIITIVAGSAALFFGSVYGISELQKIGGTFFVLYIIEKFTEIPARSIEGYAAVGLTVAGAIYGMTWFIKAHVDQLTPYIFGF